MQTQCVPFRFVHRPLIPPGTTLFISNFFFKYSNPLMSSLEHPFEYCSITIQNVGRNTSCSGFALIETIGHAYALEWVTSSITDGNPETILHAADWVGSEYAQPLISAMPFQAQTCTNSSLSYPGKNKLSEAMRSFDASLRHFRSHFEAKNHKLSLGTRGAYSVSRKHDQVC